MRNDNERSVWLRVCARDDIPVLGARVIRREGGDDVALFRTQDDHVFAVIDRCPHRGGPLSQGIVHGRSVTCPLHGATFAVRTGDVVGPPAERAVARYGSPRGAEDQRAYGQRQVQVTR